jgi:predicted phage-related endonuclease
MNAPNEIKESIGGATRYQYDNGSDSPAIMGASPFAGWQDVADRINGVSTFTGNIATRHGEQYEPFAIAKAKKHFDIEGTEQVRNIVGRYAATLDLLSDEGEFIVEVKCPYQGKKSKIWRSVMDFADPSYYVWQAHHQLLVTPSAKVHYLFIYDAESGDYCFCETMREQRHIDALCAEWEKFHAWMATGEKDPHDGWIQASQTWCDRATEYTEITAQIKDLEERQAELKKELLELGEGEKVKGAGLTLVKSVRQGNVNYKGIPELAGVDLDAYRGKPVDVWTLK